MALTQEQAALLMAPICLACGKARRKARAVPPQAVQWRCDYCLRPFCDAYQPPAIYGAEVDDYHRHRTEPNLYFPGDCFAQAYNYVRDHANDPDIRLHHGLYQELYLRTQGLDAGHAWVSVGPGVSFDPNWQCFYRTPDYYAHLAIVPQVSYTAFEARRLHRQTGHIGPWDRERRNTNRLHEHLIRVADGRLEDKRSASRLA